ncbi:choice-of-anchor L domain-containing protein [Flavobacterium sp.]|uniref:choice-of-anchor L domain-containing protein n=1 Tax=Flavobacterium sp. TaxID=239 RepID=UPI00374CDC49
MKKVLHLITLLFSIACFSQAITVNTSTYTVPQLVTDILVNKPCVPVTNITWRTGTNFGSTNGIGYFDNTNPAFPLASGVLLTTGNVLNSPGPNTTQLNDGNAAWTGDADLEATLLAAGITMNSTNATVLEFDFVPFSSNFNFQFLFASEEYGNFQCQFSDAFAFLLTNTSTGITTNLAVVPSTLTPISVVTIRDFLYNSSCPSVNPSYFGAFNGGSGAAGSATNFNGQTVVMNASSSTLIPNTTYHIKLVIADRQDNQADSAIFLGANSFNVGQDVLGQDLTIATNTAICENSTHTITSGLDPLVYSFAWTLNGNPIGGNTPNLTVNQPGIYGLTYTIIATNCVVTTDFINVEYFNAITTPDPVNLYKCNSGLPSYTFDLSFNTPIVNIAGTQISYHASLVDATSNSNPLPNSYTVTTASLPATIWVRILDLATGCTITKTFLLALTPPPVANNPGNITLCETTLGSSTADFNLATQTSAVLGGQSSTIYSVSYHTNAADSNAGTNPIDITTIFPSGNTTIFVRIQNSTDPACFNTTSFNLIVTPRPVLDAIPNQYVCVSYTLPVLVNPGTYYSGPNQGLPILPPGTVITTDTIVYIYHANGVSPSCPSERSFEVEIVTTLDITPADVITCDQYLLPVLEFNTRYFTALGGPTGGGTELFGGTTVINTPGVTTIYVYFVSTETPSCTLQSQFNVTINVTPTITGPFPTIFDCVSYNLPPLTVGDYYTLDTTTGVYTLAVSPIITTTTLYVFATSNTCRTTDIVFTVYIGTLGITDITECLSYTLPTLPIGEYRDAPNGAGNIIPAGTVITSTTTIYTYVPGLPAPNCTDDDFFIVTIQGPFITTPTDVTTCASYLLPVQPDGADYYVLSGGPVTPGNVQLIPNVDSITTTTTIYVYKPSAVVGCFNEKPWLITINQRPIIDSRANVEQCDSYILTPLTNGNYFDDPNGINPLAAGDVISTNNTIYIYAAHPSDATCFSQNSFDIAINGVEADPIPTPLSYCNSFTFPVLPTPNNFYYTLPGGPLGGGSIIPAGTIVNSTTVQATPYYIYYETGDRLNCSDENPFTILINNTPVLTPAVQTIVNACDFYTLQPLTIGKYYTLSGGPSATGNTEIVAPITYNLANPAPTTIYAYAETGTTPNCPIEQPINITIFNVTEPANVTRCSSYTLPTLPVGQNYYSSTGGVGLLPSNVIFTTQDIYVFGFSSFVPSCSDESMFTVTIVPRPIANAVTIPQECDTFGVNDGVFQFDLTTLAIRNQVLNGQTPDADFTLTFYTSLADANNPLATPIATPAAYQNDNPLIDSVWIRITNNTIPTDPCFDVVELRLIVNPLPEPVLEPEYFICKDHKTGTLLNFATLDPALSGANYSFEWTSLANGTTILATTPTYTTNIQDTYSVKVTDTSVTPNCPNTITTKVTEYEPYIEIAYSDAFENPTYIIVNVLGNGSGNYEYQIDGSPYQDSNIFYNVTPGNHIIAVNDKNGHCNPAPTNAEIVNYPKFFTPNGDGFHETWNITHLKTSNPNAPISIFDRFGKFIKQITPTTDGWNGKFNGQPLPANDYWFTVDYNEKGASKVFKSHFTLKR